MSQSYGGVMDCQHGGRLETYFEIGLGPEAARAPEGEDVGPTRKARTMKAGVVQSCANPRSAPAPILDAKRGQSKAQSVIRAEN